MRTFTAIPLPQNIRDRFTEIARGRLPIPYVNTTNFHITLNFLGDLDTDKFTEIKKEWKKAIPVFNKFRIEFDKLIKFRHQIHMTVKDNPELFALQSALQKYFEAKGYKSDYPKYYAHVTVGSLHMDRVMNKERKIEDFPNQDLNQLSFDVDRIVLFESKTLLHHPKHIELDEFRLT